MSDQLERHPLSAEYPDITGRTWERYVANLREHGIVGDRKVTLCEGKVIDGWQLYRACLEAHIEPSFAELDGIEPARFVETMNDLRRHETQEQAMRRADARREAIVADRRDGKSLRAIAEEHGVSESQVRRDIEAASTAPGGAVEPEGGKVTGKDGRTRTAAPAKKDPAPVDATPEKPPSLFCGRCQRVGPVKDCPQCADVRNAKPEREPGDDSEADAQAKATDKAKPKPGSELFDWRAYEASFGQVARAPDTIGKAFPSEKASAEYKEAIKHLEGLAKVMADWKKRLTQRTR